MNYLKLHLYLLRLLLSTSVILVTSVTASTSPVIAGAASHGAIDEAGLEVHISFPNDQLLAQWHVRVKRTLAGKVIFDRTERMALHCEVHGDVQIQDESALFQAADQSYIACTLPSLRETVYALTEKEPGGPFLLSQQCDCKTAWVAAQVRLATPTAPGAPTLYDNPIFYHPDFQYYMPQVHGPNDPMLHVQHNSVTEPFSGGFQAEDWNVVWSGIDGAEFLDNLGSWGDYFADYDLAKLDGSRHWANGAVLRYANEPSEFQLTTDKTVIYIGHNPTTQTYGDLVVKNVDWDPPCFGAGGG
jgi:hypothetical protein